MKIYLVAFFKFHSKDPHFGFERIHLQTFYSTLEKAKKGCQVCFCDEAGFYEGAVIEERIEGGLYFRGIRVWYGQNKDGKLEEFPQPQTYDHILNLIS